MRKTPPQPHIGNTLHQIRNHRPEHRHIQQRRRYRRPAEPPMPELNQQSHPIADGRPGQQRDIGRLPPRQSQRQPFRKVPRPGQGINAPPVGVDDCVKTGHQAGHRRQGQNRRPGAAAEYSSERQKQRLLRPSHRRRPRRNPRAQQQRQYRRRHQRQQPPQQSLGHIPPGIARLLRRQRQLLNRQVKPDGKGQRLNHAAPSEGQPPGIIPLRDNVQRQFPTEMGYRPHPEHRQNPQCQQGYPHRKLESRLYSQNVQPHEQDIENQPPHRPRQRQPQQFIDRRPHIPANAYHNDRRRQHILNVLRQPRAEPAPRPHSRPPKRVGPAGMRQRRRHFRNGVAQPQVHHRYHRRGDSQPAKTARAQPEVPPEKIPGDDRPHSQRPQRPDPGIAAQPPPGKILRPGFLIPQRPQPLYGIHREKI